jgi:hypothetical protein
MQRLRPAKGDNGITKKADNTQMAFRSRWKFYQDASRKKQRNAQKDRARDLSMAMARRLDRLVYCKIEIAGTALKNWVKGLKAVEIDLNKPRPKILQNGCI